VTRATSIGCLRPGVPQPEEVHKIHEVAFFGVNTALYDDLAAAEGALLSPVHLDSADSMMKEYSYSQSQAQPPIYEHPASAIMNLFTSGTFYYAPVPVWDISSRFAERIRKNKEFGDPFASFDERFVWNEFVVKSLLDFREGLDAFERENLDKCQFIASFCYPWSFRSLTLDEDPRHTRLCWDVYSYPSSASPRWRARDCHDGSDIETQLETSRDSFQCQRRGR